jgi:prepilin-type N-terminal cleavage/methylation domain-containing protein
MIKTNSKKYGLVKQKIGQRGIGLIEILVALSIFSLALAFLMGLSNFLMKLNTQMKSNTIATNLAAEAIEATLAIKQGDWDVFSALANETVYHPVKTGSPLVWALSAGEENINGFVRQITLSSVYRDSNDDIVLSGGLLDNQSRKVTATVSWIENGKNQQTLLSEYLTNWQP